MDAWRTPKLVLHAHPPDQRAQFHLNSRAPSPRVRFPTPVATKASPMPPHQRLRLNDRYDLQNRWKPSIHLDEEPAVVVGRLSSTPHPAPQDDQLMSEHRILRFKPQLRLEWRGQDGQNETEQPDHSASLGDSITSSTRIKFFGTHTAYDDDDDGITSEPQPLCWIPARSGSQVRPRPGQVRSTAFRCRTFPVFP
jgi:hypothetical protein